MLKTLTSRFRDKVLLIGLALLVCIVLVSMLWLADEHHVNTVWVLLAWNSIGLVAVVGWGFRRHWRRPAFIAFFLVWLVVHAAVVTALMGWVPMLYWLPIIGVEFFIGYTAAYVLFGLPPDQQRQ